MKVLMITPYLPYPLYSGGQIRSYNLLKNLAQRHQITLFSFMKQVNHNDIEKLQEFCRKVKVTKRREAFSPVNILFSSFSFYPFLVAIYYSFKLKAEIEAELERGKYDLIHAETFYVMPNIPRTKIPILLVEQTIEYLVYEHFVKSLKNPLVKPFLYLDVAKIRYWEKYYWQKAKMVIAMSENDKNVMQKQVPELKVEIVPNGVNIKHFSQIKKTSSNNTVLFVGNFSWLQNREAVYFLIQNIWPKVKSRIANARLWIIGQNPSLQLKSFAKKKDIKIDDRVEDISQAYSKSSVLLAPIFGPGGTRFKILEAMASGLPVVTTATGIEGIPAKNNTHLLIGENADQLAEDTIKLMTNYKLNRKLVTNAKNLVEQKFDWEIISNRLDNIYQNVSYGKN